MYSIEMSDGTILENTTCLNDDLHLFVYIEKGDLITNVTLFSDSEKTKKIVYKKDNQELQVYEGYTKFLSVSTEYGNCNIVLRKG